MVLDRSHIFFGKLKGKNIAFDKIDYNLKTTPIRKTHVEDMLQENDEFLVEYFDSYFKSNPKKDEALSLSNNICLKLEQLATYLLTSTEDKISSLEYKFYDNPKHFERALMKELSVDKMIEDITGSMPNMTDGDVLHFLTREAADKRKPKGMKVVNKDFDREDEVGQIINEYKALKENLMDIKGRIERFEYEPVNGFTPNTTKLKYMINAVDDDIFQTKYKLDRPIEFKQPLSGSNVSCWDEVDFLNPVHVECFLKLTNSPNDFDNDLGLLLNYFNQLFDEVKEVLEPKELEVLKLLRWGIKRVEKLNEALEVGYNHGQLKELYTIDAEKLAQIINKTVSLIMATYEKDIKKHLDYRRDTGKLFDYVESKVCRKCGARRPLSAFNKKADTKDGYRNTCKACR